MYISTYPLDNEGSGSRCIVIADEQSDITLDTGVHQIDDHSEIEHMFACRCRTNTKRITEKRQLTIGFYH